MSGLRELTPLQTDHSCTEIHLVLWRGLKDPQMKLGSSSTWGRFCGLEHVQVDSKKNADVFSVVTLVDPAAGRRKDNIAEVFVMGLDFDEGEPPWERLAPYEYFAHTSHSHTDIAPRWRVFLLLSDPCPGNVYTSVLQGFAQSIGANVDTSATDPSRLWFVPCSPTGKGETRRNPGALLDWRTFEQPEKAVELANTRNTVFYRGVDEELIATIASHYPPKGTRHDYRLACAGAMQPAGVAIESAEEMLVEASQRAGADTKDARAVVVDTYGNEGPTTGAQTLRELNAAPVADRITLLVTPDPMGRAVVPERHLTERHLLLELNRQDHPIANQTNARRAIQFYLGPSVRFDEFRRRILCADISPHHGRFPDGIWTDAHDIAALELVESCKFKPSKTSVRDAVVLHAQMNGFNPVKDWLEQASRQWDGIARVDRALTDYWGVEDSAGARAAGRVFLLSLVARGMKPGVKVDTCLLLGGPQGALKSTSFSVLAGGEDLFSDSPLPIGDKDALQNIRGKWLWEFSETASWSSRDVEHLKAFLSSRVDTFRASYGHHTEDVPRTCVFVATTNRRDVLRDPTGNRRYMPVWVTGSIDIAGLRRDREQLLGEAAHRVLSGEQHWPTREEDAALDVERAEYQETDPWEEPIRVWLKEREGEPVKIQDVLRTAVGKLTEHHDMAAQKRASNVLRRMGYERKQDWRRAMDDYGAHKWFPPGP